MEQSVSVDLGGKTLTINTGRMAKLAGGSAVVQLGGTVVLVAASASKTASPNRDFEQLDESDMDVVVAGTADNIIMVEGGSREVSEADMIAALEFAMGHIRRIVQAQRELLERSGKPKRALVLPVDTSELERSLDQA